MEQAARRSAGAGIAGMLLPTLSCMPSDGDEALPPLPLDEAALTAVMDEILPAEEGMPSASEAGVLDYFRLLAREVSDLPQMLSGHLERIEAAAKERFGRPFSVLARIDKIATMEHVEDADPTLFEELPTLVYEAYYVQPMVWDLIGYEPYPTGGGGPPLDPFDETMLARVAGLPPLYREAT